MPYSQTSATQLPISTMERARSRQSHRYKQEAPVNDFVKRSQSNPRPVTAGYVPVPLPTPPPPHIHVSGYDRSRSASPVTPSTIRALPARVGNATPRLPDGWVPRAHDPEGDGRLSIYVPPPHELSEPARSEDQFDVLESIDNGSPIIIPATSHSRPSSPLPPPPVIYDRSNIAQSQMLHTPPPIPQTNPSLYTDPRIPPRPVAVIPPPPVLHSFSSRPSSAPVPALPTFHHRTRAHETSFRPGTNKVLQQPARNASRASTLLSDYELLGPPRPPIVEDDPDAEPEYSSAQTFPPPLSTPLGVALQPSRLPTRPPTRANMVQICLLYACSIFNNIYCFPATSSPWSVTGTPSRFTYTFGEN
jgi:hypothetical protein